MGKDLLKAASIVLLLLLVILSFVAADDVKTALEAGEPLTKALAQNSVYAAFICAALAFAVATARDMTKDK